MKRALIIISILLSLCIAGIVHNYTITQQQAQTAITQQQAQAEQLAKEQQAEEIRNQIADIDEALAENEKKQAEAEGFANFYERDANLCGDAYARSNSWSDQFQQSGEMGVAANARANLAKLREEHQELLKQRATLLHFGDTAWLAEQQAQAEKERQEQLAYQQRLEEVKKQVAVIDEAIAENREKQTELCEEEGRLREEGDATADLSERIRLYNLIDGINEELRELRSECEELQDQEDEVWHSLNAPNS